MGKSSAPKPPDPKDTASAQTGTNIGTAIANNTMGMVDQYTPDGSLTYATTGMQSYTDPYTGKTYQIPKYSATTTLSEAQQAIKDQNNTTQLNLSQTGANQSAFLKDYLAQPGIDSTAAADRLTELGRKRLDPRFDQERGALDAKLANQGITPGSEAYNREVALFDQGKNDAYNQLYLNGDQQAFSQAIAARNQPINEITALLSGSQVSNPSVAMAQPQGAATTDVAGLINQNYNQRYANYQQQQAQQQGLLGGLFGLGASALTGGFF
mgnify:FL=1